MKRILRKVESRFVTKCYYCDTEFEYELSDVETKWNQRALAHFKVVTCPCCGRELLHHDSIKSDIYTQSL